MRPVPPDLEPVAPGELTWNPDGTAKVDADGAIVADGDRLVWGSDDGAVRAAPIAGGSAEVLAQFGYVVALAAVPEGIYALTGSALFLLPRAGGEPIGLAMLSYPEAFAVGANEIFVADGTWIRAVPFAGGRPRTLATNAGEPTSIAVTDTHVYWTDGGYDANPRIRRACVGRLHLSGQVVEPEPERLCDNADRRGAIKRVPIGGGDVQSRPLFYPTKVAVVGDHVYWADTDGEAAFRAGLDGDDLEVVFGGRGKTLAADATSTVVMTASGLVAEIPADGGPPWVKELMKGGTSLALSADTIFIVDPELGLRRLPRGPTATTVLAVPSGKVFDLAVSGDHVYYVDRLFDDRDDAVMRVPRAGGAPELVRAHVGEAAKLAVHGDHVVVSDTDENTLDAGGQPLATDVSPDAIAVDDRAVYWVQDLTVIAQPFAGGPAEIVHAPPQDAEMFYGVGGGGPPPASLIVRDGVIIAANDALGVLRIDTRAPVSKPKGKRKAKPKGKGEPTAQVLSRDASTATLAGDHVLAWTGQGLVDLDTKRVLYPAGDGSVPDVYIADTRDAWMLRDGQLIRVPLDGSTPTVVLAGASGSVLAIDDDAVYFDSNYGEAVLRVAR